jgi:hypothetical protein
MIADAQNDANLFGLDSEKGREKDEEPDKNRQRHADELGPRSIWRPKLADVDSSRIS